MAEREIASGDSNGGAYLVAVVYDDSTAKTIGFHVRNTGRQLIQFDGNIQGVAMGIRIYGGLDTVIALEKPLSFSAWKSHKGLHHDFGIRSFTITRP